MEPSDFSGRVMISEPQSIIDWVPASKHNAYSKLTPAQEPKKMANGLKLRSKSFSHHVLLFASKLKEEFYLPRERQREEKEPHVDKIKL